ncbi:hypothetical protein IWY39_002567 [Sphingobium sp. JAI105]|uniref:hypothetical protein n=1 Tax=Sphingobium sp. JAI105 TaxID=2787715 RepID=UPI0018CAE464|nr:hypothetical protein [Sphingobium sp. JAI105]MBG6116205.1 hypothetical protein [Sphingobium sp. JAI105]MBG6118763.1 hypothetical protein [Sphingobium sp. JAI105]
MMTVFEQLVRKAETGKLDEAQLEADLPKVQAEVRANAVRTVEAPVETDTPD